MTRYELKVRCVALASVGDAAAIQTLAVMELCDQQEKLLAVLRSGDGEKELRRMRVVEGNCRYVLERIQSVLVMARSLELFGNVATVASVAKDVPTPIKHEDFLPHGESRTDALRPQGDPEVAAVAETRRQPEPPAQPDRAVTGPNCTNKAAGYWVKTLKTGADLEGKKSES